MNECDQKVEAGVIHGHEASDEGRGARFDLAHDISGNSRYF